MRGATSSAPRNATPSCGAGASAGSSGLRVSTRAKESLTVTLAIDRLQNSVSVTAEADLGGTLLSRHLPLLGRNSGPATMQAKAATQCGGGLVEVVLALDVTGSMNGKIDKTGAEGPDNRKRSFRT